MDREGATEGEDAMDEEQKPDDAEHDDAARLEQMVPLKMQRQYYKDALRFTLQVSAAVPWLCQMLSSRTKSDVVEAIRFFVVAHEYQLPDVHIGVRKMVHLVWSKDADASEDGKGVKKELIEAYRLLFLSPPANLSEKESVRSTVQGLIKCVQ